MNKCSNSCTMWRKDLKAFLYKYKEYFTCRIMWRPDRQHLLLKEVVLNRYFCKVTLQICLFGVSSSSVTGAVLPAILKGWKKPRATEDSCSSLLRQTKKGARFPYHFISARILAHDRAGISIISLTVRHSIGLHKITSVSNRKLFLQRLISVILHG